MNEALIWIKEDDRDVILLTAISAIFLMMSIFTNISFLGIDLAWGAILISGVPIVYGSLRQLVLHKDIKAGLLVSIALVACVVVGEYFAAGEVVVIMMIGELLENYTVRKSKMGLQKLIELKPMTARVLKNGEYITIESKDVCVGDHIRVIAGESIPVDGIILSGNTSIDQSIMTGESIPVDKIIGDEVYSATVNTVGTIVVEATKVGEDSSIAKMIQMIKEAENKKAPILTVMDQWASYLVIIALILSVLIGIVTKDPIRAITVLVVFCPCALVLATPTAIAAGIGNATRHGIIIKSGEALERLGKVVRIAFDKTGTLTIGEPEVESIHFYNSEYLSEEKVYSLVASAEMHSEHLFGKAICRMTNENNTKLVEPSYFKVRPGKGVEAVVDGYNVIVGNIALMDFHNVSVNNEVLEKLKNGNEEGLTGIIVCIDHKIIGIITLLDQLRKDSVDIISKIHKSGKKVSLLTGDNDRVASRIASAVNIDEYKASLLPEDKVDAIETYQQNGERTCMVGDGINDAPALKSAFVSIAMAGIGSDIAAESSDIVLVKDDISKLPYVMALSKDVIRKINENIVISMTLNFAAIGLAAYGILTPVTGALVHNVGSVLVVINAALLLNKDENKTFI